MLTINGTLNDGKSSRRNRASLSQADVGGVGGVLLKTDRGEFLIAANEIQISSRLGNSARYIELGDFGRFETKDNDAVDELSKLLGHQSNFTHKLESNLGLIALAVVLTAVVMWATIKFGVPAAADAIVDAFPEGTSDYLEEKILEEVEERLFSPSEIPEARQAELQALFSRVSIQLSTTDKNYVFKLRKAGKDLGANALAFPSGTIIMTDDLVKLAKSDKQIAGVMAHEIGHLDGRHSLRQIVRGSIITVAIAFIAGDVSGASAAVLSTPAVLMELQYSREFETDADRYALRYFECDIDGLRDMGQFFITLSNYDDKDLEKGYIKEAKPSGNERAKTDSNDNQSRNFLSTHPASNDRQHFFEEHIKDNC